MVYSDEKRGENSVAPDAADDGGGALPAPQKS